MAQTYVMGVTDTPRISTASVDTLGAIRFIGNKVYKFVKLISSPNDSSVDAAANDAAVYTDYSAHEVGVDATDIEATNLAAGVFIQTVDMGDEAGYYLWIQIKGPATVVAPLGTPVAGTDLQGSSTDKKFTKSVTLVQRAATFITGTEVILDCPF